MATMDTILDRLELTRIRQRYDPGDPALLRLHFKWPRHWGAKHLMDWLRCSWHVVPKRHWCPWRSYLSFGPFVLSVPREIAPSKMDGWKNCPRCGKMYYRVGYKYFCWTCIEASKRAMDAKPDSGGSWVRAN